jgi:hypothetical protein
LSCRLVGEETPGGCIVSIREEHDAVYLTRQYEEFGHPVMDAVVIPFSDVAAVIQLLAVALKDRQVKHKQLVANGVVF